MAKRLIFIMGLFLLALTPYSNLAFASDANTEPQNVPDASFQSRCQLATEMGYPECADSPSECGSEWMGTTWRKPFNCEFLQEPIGGRTGYDLFKLVQQADGETFYQLWYGEVLAPGEYGPFQAILTYEEGKEIQGPFSLVYNYLGLVYNFASGLIVAIVILMVIVGGVRISAAGGNAEGDKGGKEMIIKALIGMVIWFTASVILYTINPTFFAF